MAKQKREDLITRRNKAKNEFFETIGAIYLGFIFTGLVIGIALYISLHAQMFKQASTLLLCLIIIDLISVYLFVFWVSGEPESGSQD